MRVDEMEEKCSEAEKLKAQGNEQFRLKDYVRALRFYHQADLYVSGLVDK